VVDAIAVREARAGELALLPPLEKVSDEMFLPLGIGPFEPGTVDDLAAALVVLVVGDPPEGFARLDVLRNDGGAPAAPGSLHLEQLSVHPYRDVPWNGPFYASEGFVEVGPVDEWYAERGLAPEGEVVSRGGARVLMMRRVQRP